MTQDFSYPVVLRRVRAGGFVVTCSDLPEVVTQGESRADALLQAADALEEALAGRIRRDDPIPLPSPAGRRHVVTVPPITAAKAALTLALREAGLTKVELAERLGVDEKQVRRLLDPRHTSRMDALSGALAVLGKSLGIRVLDRVA
jgi:antitoxin HicB